MILIKTELKPSDVDAIIQDKKLSLQYWMGVFLDLCVSTTKKVLGIS